MTMTDDEINQIHVFRRYVVCARITHPTHHLTLCFKKRAMSRRDGRNWVWQLAEMMRGHDDDNATPIMTTKLYPTYLPTWLVVPYRLIPADKNIQWCDTVQDAYRVFRHRCDTMQDAYRILRHP